MNQNVKGEFSQTGKSQQIVLLYIKPWSTLFFNENIKNKYFVS
jgi:hypothetical protein